MDKEEGGGRRDREREREMDIICGITARYGE